MVLPINDSTSALWAGSLQLPGKKVQCPDSREFRQFGVVLRYRQFPIANRRFVQEIEVGHQMLCS
jgi:hypothetical protein